MTATGSNSMLDLRAIRSIDAGFGHSFFDGNVQQISASSGGAINLSGVQSLRGPSFAGDHIELMVSSGGHLDLSGLRTVNSAGNGQVKFGATDGLSMSLPALQSASNAFFEATGGGSIHASGATQIVYSSREVWFDNGDAGNSTFFWPLMSATGANSVLNLPAIRSIDASFSHGVFDSNVQRVTASGGGAINLSNVKFFTGPIDPGDRFEFTATGVQSSIDLSTLAVIRGGGQLAFSVENTSSMRLGPICPTRSATIDVHDTGRLTAVAGLNLGSSVALQAQATASLDIAGRFSFQHTDESQVDLGDKTVGGPTVTMRGGGQQLVEVGGTDLGTATFLIANGNFGMGRLVVGQPGQPTDVILLDIADNGNRGGNFEALYLYGSGASDGLAISAGSRLVLNDVNVYAKIGGTYVSLKSLIPVGQTQVAFGGGTIELRRDPVITGDLNVDGVVDANDIDLEFQAISGSSLHPRFDLFGGGGATQADVDHLVLNILHKRYGDANLDGLVNLADFNRLATNFGNGCVGWAGGDFDGNDLVGLSDFNILASNFGLPPLSAQPTAQEWSALAAAAAAVPEPIAGMNWLVFTLAASAGRYRRRRSG
jgi:hypothetical protein